MLLSASLIGPSSLHLDAPSRRLYWIDSWGNRVLRANLDGEEVEMILGTSSAVTFRADGTPISASVSGSGLSIRSMREGASLGEIDSGSPLKFPSLSRGGDLVAAVTDADRQIILFETASGQETSRLPLRADHTLGTQLSPDGTKIAIGTLHDISMIDVRSGQVLWKLPFDRSNSHYPMCFSGDGTRFSAFLFGREIFVLDAITGETTVRRVVPGKEQPIMALSPDGRTVAYVSNHSNVSIVDVESSQEITTLAGREQVTTIAISPDGKLLAVLSKNYSGFDLRTVHELSDLLVVWDLETERPIRSSRVAPTNSASLAFSADAERIAIADGTRSQLVDIRMQPTLELRGNTSYVYYVAYSPDGTMLASAAWDGTVRLWDPLTGDLLATLKTGRAHPLDAGLGFTPDGEQVVFGDLMWNVATGQRIENEVVAGDEYPPDLWSGFWKKARGGTRGHRAGNFAGENAATSFDHSLLVTVSREGEILIYELLTGQLRKIVPERARPFWTIAASPDNSKILTSWGEDNIAVWDAESGAQLALLEGHQGPVYSVNYSPDGTRIVSASRDQTVIVWDAESLEAVLELTGPRNYIHSVTFSPDGEQIAAGSGDSVIYIWDSVRRSVRSRQAEEARRLRERIAPLVSQMLRDLEEPAQVAERLRKDESLSDEERRAALRVLLRLATD